MGLLSLFLISVGLSVDSFAASVTTGICIKKLTWKHVFKIAFFMAVFQGGAPVIGWLIGKGFSRYIESYDHWVAFFLLLIIGLKMIYDSLQKDDEEKCFCPSKNFILAGMALATSIDALILGVGLGVLKIKMWIPVLLIGVTTFVFSASGVIMGNKLGHKLNVNLLLIGGLVLIGLGSKILIEHLYFQ
jgi:putative Mn2+ efflux pump MntP